MTVFIFSPATKRLLCSFLKHRVMCRKPKGVVSPQICGAAVCQLHVFHGILGSFPMLTVSVCPAPEQVQSGNMHLCAQKIFEKDYDGKVITYCKRCCTSLGCGLLPDFFSSILFIQTMLKRSMRSTGWRL